ncbi:hypothetical protein BG846_02684 [Streptomyces fradiae ATCC 10745 = DSM 40063]|uniref:Uncharacterized protein n=1 Tax=Streptomyces fradiae ATCC 10745 = DSM 40063 TaxID=1319510 RepID=A0A1Y2NVX3_STRFR|nr:hypothetical protein BG846_02684 [Streptomyces fradiae ATCC 10745 = DSM 40063]
MRPRDETVLDAAKKKMTRPGAGALPVRGTDDRLKGMLPSPPTEPRPEEPRTRRTPVRAAGARPPRTARSPWAPGSARPEAARPAAA